MIYVTYAPKKRVLKIKGHARFSNEGHDIVCAAASMVFYNLCSMLCKYDKDKAFIKLDITDKKGNASVEVTPKSGYEIWVDHDFYYALSGFSVLSNKYPDYINLKVTEK